MTPGFEEFSCGALVDANSIRGTFPGDPNSNDPEGEIKQPFHPDAPSGGFLMINVRPEDPTAEFSFYYEKGALLYSAGRKAI